MSNTSQKQVEWFAETVLRGEMVLDLDLNLDEQQINRLKIELGKVCLITVKHHLTTIAQEIQQEKRQRRQGQLTNFADEDFNNGLDESLSIINKHIKELGE